MVAAVAFCGSAPHSLEERSGAKASAAPNAYSGTLVSRRSARLRKQSRHVGEAKTSHARHTSIPAQNTARAGQGLTSSYNLLKLGAEARSELLVPCPRYGRALGSKWQG